MKRWWLAAVACLVVGAACDSGGGEGGGDAADTAGDTGGVDVVDDTAPDVADDTGGPPADAVDDAADAAEETDEGATCQLPCLNEFGKNDKKLCPDPKSEWNCIEGCCVPVFRCESDADCLAQGFDEGQCLDTRFDCRCDTGTGVCAPWYCAVDGDCAGTDVCVAGACKPPTSAEGLAVRILSRPTVLTTGATAGLVAEAYDPADPDVAVAAAVTWSSATPAAVAVDPVSGVVTGGAASGTAAITATLGAESDTVEVRNVVPAAGATLTVVPTEEGSLAPMKGLYALTERGTATVVATGAIPDDGIITYDGAIDGSLDVYLLGSGTDWVAWLAAAPGVLYLPAPRTFWGKLSLDKETELVEEETVLKGANVLRGVVDFADYPKQGELDLSLSSFPFSTTLFDFSLESILGANVKRYWSPEAAIPGVDENSVAELPGGLTFALESPAIPEFVLAAPKGRHLAWTLGGRIQVDEVAEFVDDIFSAINGGTIDFGLLVSALVPLFGDFWSALTPTPEFAGDGTPSISTISPRLDIPLGLTSRVTVPDLPPFAALGLPDSVFMIGGAITPDALFYPLGLSAGTDAQGSAVPDGVVDAIPATPEKDAFELPLAPMHSGVGGPSTRYAVAVVAISILGEDDPRPEGGSAILHRAEPGEAPGALSDLPAFLGFPVGSTWDAQTRTVTVVPVDGADTQRVLFKGKTGEHWTVWLNGQSGATLPTLEDLVGAEVAAALADRTEDPQIVLVNSFDLSEGVSLDALAAPGGEGLDTLLNTVDRASFVDID